MTQSDDQPGEVWMLDVATALPPGFVALGHHISAVDARTLLLLAALASAWVPFRYPRSFLVAEVGSFVGLTTLLLAIYAAPTTLYAIDTWEGSVNSPEDDINRRYSAYPVKAIFDHNVRLAGFGSQEGRAAETGGTMIVPICRPSVEAARVFAEGSLDLVFIDADHSYESVKEDIETWLPKVRAGGVLCGHDYNVFAGVSQAVDERSDLRSTLPSSLWWRQC